jgi:hypothetical protein
MKVIVEIDDDHLNDLFEGNDEETISEEQICQEIENALGDYFAKPSAFSVSL